MGRRRRDRNGENKEEKEKSGSGKHAHVVDEYFLYTYADAPFYLRRAFITDGYRGRFSFPLCVQSLFRLHNETLNVWTHLLAAFLFMAITVYSQLYQVKEGAFIGDRIVLLTFLFCSIYTFTVSTVYHLFKCTSEDHFEVLSKHDYLGITVLISASVLPGIYFGMVCFPLWRWIHIVVDATLILFVAFTYLGPVFEEDSRRLRVILFAMMALYAVIPLAQWTYLHGLDAIDVQLFLWRIIVAYLLFGVGLFFYLTHIPERFFPGRNTSIWCHSHILWHVWVTFGCLWLYDAGWKYYQFTEGTC